jgi:pantoate--beta-alanine ligase
MGNLHQGHLSLVQKSLSENEHTIVTIFVNPKQFGPKDDFQRYPRTLSKDIELLEATNTKSLTIFAPKTLEDIYPINFSTLIHINNISDRWEGPLRPGHFDGVATVVYVLFALSRPQTAYFGLKDYQQVQVIQKMTTDLMLGIKIIPCPIVRASDGLALSSRNQYLSPEGRKKSLILPQTLQEAARIAAHSGFEELKKFLQKSLSASENNWEYLAYCDPETLEPLLQIKSKGILLGVLTIEGTRLLDNLLIEADL